MWQGEVKVNEQVKARWLFTSRTESDTLAGFGQANYATHVGDDFDKVTYRRADLALRIPEIDQVVWPTLTHDHKILEISKPVPVSVTADLLITRIPRIALATLGADCAMVLAIAVHSGFVASAHIGWAGAAAGAAQNLVAAFTSRQVQISEVQFLIGPTICGDCYSVSEDRQHAVAARLPAAAQNAGIDLRRGLSAYFESLGGVVTAVGGCTYESTNLYSHRRDPHAGRQAGLVVLV